MKWGEMRSPEIGETDKAKIVVVPVAALEQHGQHLPTLTDTMISDALVARIEAALANDVLILPTLWLGASDHHLAFPGTVSLHLNTYTQVVCELTESILQSGFRKIFFLNCHGGNMVPGAMAINIVKQRHRDMEGLWLVFSAYWELAANQMRAVKEMETWRITHSCEYETSMVLLLFPDLVDMTVAQGGTARLDSDYCVPDYSRPGRLIPAYLFNEVTVTGAMGRPDLAHPEKGRKLIDAISSEIISFLRDFHKWGKMERGIAE